MLLPLPVGADAPPPPLELQASEATALCSDGAAEGAALGASFGALFALRWRLVTRQALLNLATFFFEYLGSVVNYVAVGVALCGGMYDERPVGELSLIISRGSTFAITMVYGLTQLVAAMGTAAELSGHTRRVAALLRGLHHVETTTAEWRRREESGAGGALRRWRPRDDDDDDDDAPPTTKEGGEAPMLLEGRRLRICLPPVHAPTAAGRAAAAAAAAVVPADPAAATARPTLLLRSVELRVRVGGALLVRGAAAVGKTALLRVLCGLWPMGERAHLLEMVDTDDADADAGANGDGKRGERGDGETGGGGSKVSELTCVPPLWLRERGDGSARSYLVLPQAAPLRPGLSTSVLEQLVYPLMHPDDVCPRVGGGDAPHPHHQQSHRQRVETAACEALAAVGLGGLLEQLGGLHRRHSVQVWHTALSPGQRQQLVCARIFVHAPALVLLDEATSAMPAADEARIYARLRALGIAYVSVGHRTSLEPYHDEIVDLKNEPRQPEVWERSTSS